MSIAWVIILVSAVSVFGLKLTGYLIPAGVLSSPRVQSVLGGVTVALLGALVAVQAFTTSGAVVFDARVVALGVAALLLWMRAPFIVVVVAGAAVAALLRLWLGM